MKMILYILIVVACCEVKAVSFRQRLAQNVDRYKENNFRWNKRNLDYDKFVSLRNLEARKDKEFNEYLQQRKQGVYKPQSRRIMMYSENKVPLQATMYKYPPDVDQQPLLMMYGGTRSPDVMMYNAVSEDNPKPRYIMMYNAKEMQPQAMMYDTHAQAMMYGMQPQAMMYDTQPLSMMYGRPPDVKNQQPALIMDGKRSPHVMMYNDASEDQQQPVLMMYGGTRSPDVMMYNAVSEDNPKPRYVMMYNAKEMQPQAMMYDTHAHAMMYGMQPQAMMYDTQPLSMMYWRPPDVKNQQPALIMDGKRSPHVMMYNDASEDQQQPVLMMYGGTRSPDVMMYNAVSEDNPKPRYIMMYNAKEMQPQAMMYDTHAQAMMYGMQPQAMMYDTQPLSMMYGRPPDVKNQQPALIMDGKRSPHVMMYNDASEDQQQPLLMMYGGTRSPDVMMYNAVSEDNPKPRYIMMYNAKEMQPQAMMYDTHAQAMMYGMQPQAMMYDTQPLSMMYGRPPDVKNQQPALIMDGKRSPHVMMYNDASEDQQQPVLMMYGGTRSPDVMMYNAVSEDNPKPRYIMMYNAKEMQPQAMMYEMQPQAMMYDTQPLSMMYERPSDVKNQQPALIMDGKRSPHVMMYNDASEDQKQPVLMMYGGTRSPDVMMYNAVSEDNPKPRYIMMYNAQEMQPQAMMYEMQPQAMMYDTQPLSMMYERPSDVKNQQPALIMDGKRSPHVMMYNDASEDQQQPVLMMYGGTRSPDVMMYNAVSEDNPKPRYIMMYNAQEMQPQAMMYDTHAQVMMYDMQPQAMMYDTQPLSMMYGRPPDVKNQQPALNMDGKRSPHVMMYNDASEDHQQPVLMMYGGRTNSPDVMKYNVISEDNPEPRHVMMHVTKDILPLSMMYDMHPLEMVYNHPPDVEILQPDLVMDGKRSPQVLMYNAISEDDPRPKYVMKYDAADTLPQGMMYNVQSQAKLYNRPPHVEILQTELIMDNHPPKKTQGTRKRIIQQNQSAKQKEQTTSTYSYQWFNIVETFITIVPKTAEEHFQHWKQTISIFGDNDLARQHFKLQFPAFNIDKVIQAIEASNIFEKLYWPFVYENGFMNQKLGLLGLSGRSVKPKHQKLLFYEVLEKHQTLEIPVQQNIIYSFNDTKVVDALNRSGLQEMSKEYVRTGRHLYTADEQTYIVKKVNAAMKLINNTMPELFRVIHQVIGCIAFYKAQHPGYAGGTVSSALGVIWQDPRAYKEQSVAHYAEQIVHEYIHTSLFLADLVHGTFADFKLLSRAKVYSPIRHELRDFDKTFHASYVSTGVALFHARAGNWEKAKTLAEPLRASVDGLMMLNKEVGILNDSGNAMLQAMDDFLTIIRLL